MAMGKLPVIGVAALGTSGVIGGSYLFLTKNSSKEENVKTLKDKYKLAILVSEKDWNYKFSKLKVEGTAPIYEPLKKAYNKRTTHESEAKGLHKKACEDVYKLPETTTAHLGEFAKYCFFNNLDKSGGGKSLITTNGDFQDKWDTFTQKSEKTLSPELIDALKNKGTVKTDSGWQGKMVTGCKNLSENIYEGENEDFKGFCLK